MTRSLIRASAWKTIAVASVALSAVFVNAQEASAVVLAQWTFEPQPFTDAVGLNKTAGPAVAASTGTGTATGLHASAATDWTTPTGNGSTDSYSANTWGVNDYFQFTTSSLTYENLVVSWDQTGSGTGPRDFDLFYSTGAGFTSAFSYDVPFNGTPALSSNWNATLAVTGSSFSFNFGAITALDNAATVIFRLVNTSTTSIGTPPAAPGIVGTGGTSRVDNFTVSGTLIPPPSGVPLPSSLLVFGGCAGIAGVARRRLQAIFA